MKTKNCLDELFAEYIDVCEYSLRRRPATIKSYKEAYKHLRKLVPELTKTHQLSTTVLNQFFKELQTRKRVVGRDTIKVGVKDSTVATYWGKLNTFFIWLESNGYITANPLSKITKPKEIYTDKKALKKEQIERIYSSITLHSKSSLLARRDIAMISTLFFTGARKTEFISLQLRDIDLQKKMITIRAETSKSKRTRVLPINPTLANHLNDYLKERKKYQSEKLFVSSTKDEGLTSHGLKHWVKRLNKTSGVKFHLHQFRHTFACNLAKNNIELPNLQKLMGHTDLRMTQRYLRSLGPEHLIEDILKLSIEDSY